MRLRLNLITLSMICALSACQPPAAENNAQSASDDHTTTTAVNNNSNEINITINDKACEPMELTVPSGEVTFNVKNASGRALEWEILKDVMVVDERENIAPNLSAKMTTTLLPGEYTMTCGLLNNPHGKLIVNDSGFKDTTNQADLDKLIKPLEEYKTYVKTEVSELVKKTTAFTAAIKAGKIEEAKSLFAPTRAHYERIEPIAELFNELDPAIDAREDDFKNKAQDEKFTGFHRLEYALWIDKSTKGMDKIADELLNNVKKLESEINVLNFPPSKVVGGAADLIEEVASSKISGEEDRYSHTDLSDFNANVEGSQKIVELLHPLIENKNKTVLANIDQQFKQVNAILSKYKKGNTFETYDKLSETDRKALQVPINSLAEDLAKLRGLLGLK